MLFNRRLRYPRNHVHVNLFIAIALRLILTIVSGELIENTKFQPKNSVQIAEMDPKKVRFFFFLIIIASRFINFNKRFIFSQQYVDSQCFFFAMLVLSTMLLFFQKHCI